MAVLSKAWRDVSLRGFGKEVACSLSGVGARFIDGDEISIHFRKTDGEVVESFAMNLTKQELREIERMLAYYRAEYPGKF